MLTNKIEFSSYKKLDSDNIKLNLLQNNKDVFIKNRIYDEYSFISKLSLIIVKVLPINSLKFLYKFGIFINPELDDDYKQFLYARLEHILLNYDDAIVNYSKITDKNSYYNIAQYWHKRINSSQSVLKKYEDILSSFEKNYKDGKEDGKSIEWYLNGQIKSERNYKEGKKDGNWTEWYKNGQLKIEKNYKNDKFDGKFTWWHENGQKWLEANYINDECVSGNCDFYKGW
jgi:antitoxin component YwqK of YwqJK toxin-antitoxin module